jgi:hypothetical protein
MFDDLEDSGRKIGSDGPGDNWTPPPPSVRDGHLTTPYSPDELTSTPNGLMPKDIVGKNKRGPTPPPAPPPLHHGPWDDMY